MTTPLTFDTPLDLPCGARIKSTGVVRGTLSH